MVSPYGALPALNFFMADVRDGLGPFLGIFLQQNGWNAAAIGGVMTRALPFFLACPGLRS
jgi:hypothetical protein